MAHNAIVKKTFTAIIEDRGGWICIVWPESVSFFGSTKSVKVKGTMNGVAFQTAFMPWGDGTQFLPVSKKLLKAMKKHPGDTSIDFSDIDSSGFEFSEEDSKLIDQAKLVRAKAKEGEMLAQLKKTLNLIVGQRFMKAEASELAVTAIQKLTGLSNDTIDDADKAILAAAAKSGYQLNTVSSIRAFISK